MSHDVVETDSFLIEINIKQQREVIKLAEKILRLGLVNTTSFKPYSLNYANRDVHIFGENCKLAEARLLFATKQIEADTDCPRYGICARNLATRVEGEQAFFI